LGGSVDGDGRDEEEGSAHAGPGLVTTALFPAASV
jgi:hypothetical protein